MLRAVALLVAAGIVSIPVSAAQRDDGPFVALFQQPVATADIVAAVGDCVDKSGGSAALTAMGYAPIDGAFGTSEMTVHRRGARGALLILPNVANPLRCWIMGSPVDDRTTVVAAIGAKLGVANRGDTGMPGWQVGGHALAFDWFEEPGKPVVTRIEVYKFPQETK